MTALWGFRLLAGALCLAALPACGSDLGDSDPEAAKELVYGRGGLVATKGQALLHDTCGNAAFCHSAKARGEDWLGAPLQLNFDMLPEPTGWPTVVAHRDEIWEIVFAGEMPPKGDGQAKVGDGDWMFDPRRRPGASKLPRLSSDQGKAALRNWLASGAPVVTATAIPTWAQPSSADAGSTRADWGQIFAGVIQPSCALAGCHNQQSAAGGLTMASECDAYKHLLAASSCGEPRVIPSDGGSLLLDKLESDAPTCGALRMPPPPFPPLPEESVAAIRSWIEDGAAAEQCP